MKKKTSYHPSELKKGDWQKPQVIVTGRSNAGKSTLLNQLLKLSSKNAARISQKPGCTASLSFFPWQKGYLVDSPGYGYAARSHSQREHWRRQIETYLSKSPGLKGAIILMDSRRDWTESEWSLLFAMNNWEIPLGIVLTKTDKLRHNQLHEQVSKIKDLGLEQHHFLVEVFCVTHKDSASLSLLKRWIIERLS